MKKHKSAQLIQKRSAWSWSYGNIGAIALFASIATYILTSAYAEQSQPPLAVAAEAPARSSALPVWATALALFLPFAILLPISLARKQRERAEMLLNQSRNHGPALVKTLQSAPVKPVKKMAKPIVKPLVQKSPKPVKPAKPLAAPVPLAAKPKPLPPPPAPAPAPQVSVQITHAESQVVAPTQATPQAPHEPGWIPPNDLGIGISLKDMVVTSMRQEAAKRRNQK